ALALLDPAPSALAFDRVTFALLFLGGAAIILFFRDRGWHPAGALVAALAFAFGGSANSRLQHIDQIASLCYFAITLCLLARALERRSWRIGLAAGVFGGLLASDRDHVALLSLYVLAAFAVAYVVTQPRERLRASLAPLAAAAGIGIAIAAVPVVLTALLAARSNRPEIAYAVAGSASLHPVNLMTLAFADLFHAADLKVGFWGPPRALWHKAFGSTGLWTSDNMGMVYSGAIPLVAVASYGIVRGLAWSREIRFFAIAAAVVLLYALGWYTPAFHVMYELPGISLFRRPADATFVLGALIAVMAGYFVHRLLVGTVARATRAQRAAEIGIAFGLVALAVWLAT